MGSIRSSDIKLLNQVLKAVFIAKKLLSSEATLAVMFNAWLIIEYHLDTFQTLIHFIKWTNDGCQISISASYFDSSMGSILYTCDFLNL